MDIASTYLSSHCHYRITLVGVVVQSQPES
jgi:hypothetical protein